MASINDFFISVPPILLLLDQNPEARGVEVYSLEREGNSLQTERERVCTPFSTFILYILPRTEYPAHRGSLFADKHIFILAETSNKNLVLSRSSSSKHDKITRTGSRESRLCENLFCHMLIVMIYL